MTAEQLEVLKHFTAAKVAALNEDEGRFTALVSVFGNVDSQGDIVSADAFDEAIEKFEGGDWVLPVVWSHDFWRAESVIGEVVALTKTEIGLEVEGILDIADSDTARTVFRHMKRGRITEFSFSGLVKSWSIIRSDGDDDGALRIEKLDLWEVGPCFKGANPETRLLSVKSRVAKTKTELPAAEPVAIEELEVEPAEQDEPLETPEPVEEPEPTPDATEVAPADPEPVGLSKATQALLGLIAIP